MRGQRELRGPGAQSRLGAEAQRGGGCHQCQERKGRLREELCPAPAWKGWGEERSGGEPGEEEMGIGVHGQCAEEALESLSRKREAGETLLRSQVGN